MASSNGTSTVPARIISEMVRRPAYLSAPRQGGVRNLDIMSELGTTGLRQFGGFVLEEWLSQLTGKRAAWAYREMIDNDPVVGGILFAIDMLARNVSWWCESPSAKEDPRAEFIWSCMHDMSQTWEDVVCEALSFVPYGWAFNELVYKLRDGTKQDTWESDPAWRTDVPETEEDHSPASSQYTDRKIGWRKIPVRAQETLMRWHFDGYSGIKAMEQIDWHGGDHVIPIQKALLFRTKTTRNNPEGRSILRNSWIPYYSLKNIQNMESIGIERELAGIPIATPPEGVDLFLESNASLKEEVFKMVTSIRRDEYEGIVLPSAGWEIELLHSGGPRQIDTDKIVRRYEQRIASSILADFILIGQDAIGSYAMVDVKSDLFGIAMDTILNRICEPFNRYGIPRLLALNGMSVEEAPQIRHSSAGRLDLEKVGTFFREIYQAGAPIPWSKELIGQLFSEAGLPANFEGELETEEYPTGEVNRVSQDSEQHPERSTEERNTEQSVEKLEKAEQTVSDHGTTIRVAPALARRANILSEQLDRELQGALSHLGEQAATAYLTHAEKARVPGLNRIVNRVLKSLDIAGWVETRLRPILKNHAGRVAGDTQRVIGQQVDQEVRIADRDVLAMSESAGQHLQLKDIEPQIRTSIGQAIRQSYEAGDHVTKTAQRIRSMVPAGRFTHAGPKYRSRLIAKDQTAGLQREAALSTYKSMANIVAIRLSDGIYGPPRSDQACISRDGEIVPIGDAGSVEPMHPGCTLGFEPVVANVAALAPAPAVV